LQRTAPRNAPEARVLGHVIGHDPDPFPRGGWGPVRICQHRPAHTKLSNPPRAQRPLPCAERPNTQGCADALRSRVCAGRSCGPRACAERPTGYGRARNGPPARACAGWCCGVGGWRTGERLSSATCNFCLRGLGRWVRPGSAW
jgi:hypothetical protein